MAAILHVPLASGANSFPPSPTLSPEYNDIHPLDAGFSYPDGLDGKQSFVPTEYDTSFVPSVTSTTPSSPTYTHYMGSRDSYFSTPSYSSLDPNEDFDYDDEDPFPSFENNGFERTETLDSRTERFASQSTETSSTASIPNTPQTTCTRQSAKDDLDIEYEPSRHVDYLSHEWEQQDVWSSWRYITTRRNKITNSERLENAAWRTWTKSKYSLRTISPESLNWMKDCDVTWLYGPLHKDGKNGLMKASPPPSRLSTSSSFLNKKPILKKRSPSAILLEKSLNDHTLLQRAGDIIQVQRSSPVPTRPGLRRGGSDFSLPSFHTSSVLNTPADGSEQSDATARSSFGTQTPFEAKHVFFNEEVRQVQAIDSEDDEKDAVIEESESESDEDDDGGLMMAPARTRSNRSTPRNSFNDGNKTIAPLPSTTLKSRGDTPEPPSNVSSGLGNFFMPQRSLQHSSSQETLKPTKPSHNFLLDDDPELDDGPWLPQSMGPGRSPYAQEYQDQPEGMRRTASGMFMPYDENEEEAAVNNGLFGQAVYAVNTFKDIAHVIWNVGWSRR